MRTLTEVKGRCRVNEHGCWLWQGGMTNQGTMPNIYGPDYSRKAGGMSYQSGPRAVWHMKTRGPIADGYKVYRTCCDGHCVNPAHLECIAVSEWGARKKATGEWRGVTARVVANRKSSRARSWVQDASILALAANTVGPAREVAQQFGLSRSMVDKLRRGEHTAFTPVGSVFSGLMIRREAAGCTA